MRIVVTGASGNVGTQVLRHLLEDPTVEAVTGICRRPPSASLDPRLQWIGLDIAHADAEQALGTAFDGADAVVHLAWILSPSHDAAYMSAVNVDGSRRVFSAAAAAGVSVLVHASSVGAYSPRGKDTAVDESWPTGGIATSTYSRHKSAAERLLDETESDHPEMRVVRLRPGLIFQRAAGSEIARYFLGPLVPRPLLRRGLIPLVPRVSGIALQALHASDAGTAYHLAVSREVRGAFNIAAEPVLDPAALTELLGARPVRIPAGPLRVLVDLTWRLRLQPTEAGWLDMGRQVPLMDTTRARTELGWQPAYSAGEALLELLDGLAHKAVGPTPVLGTGPSVRQLFGG